MSTCFAYGQTGSGKTHVCGLLFLIMIVTFDHCTIWHFVHRCSVVVLSSSLFSLSVCVCVGRVHSVRMAICIKLFTLWQFKPCTLAKVWDSLSRLLLLLLLLLVLLLWLLLSKGSCITAHTVLTHLFTRLFGFCASISTQNITLKVI